ncbi:MAG: hypothetical protein ACW9XA_06500 [Candidatus Nitrosopumilus sp. bin_6a]
MNYIKPEKRIFTAFSDFYKKLCEGSDSKFNGKAELFVVGLVLGFLNNKRNLTEKPFEMVRFSHFHDKKRSDLKTIIEMIYATMAEGKNDNEKWQDMLKIADGGIEYLKEHYDKTGDNVDASILIKDVEKLIDGKVKEISG